MVNNPIKGTIVWALFLTVCIGGCVTVTGGKDFNEGNVPKILIGKTTKSEVSTYLGSPESRNQGVDGSEVWNYNHRIVKSRVGLLPGQNKEDRDEKNVNVIFGKNGIVKECTYTTTSYQNAPQYSQGYGVSDIANTRCQSVR